MKEKTELAVVDLYRVLLTRHLRPHSRVRPMKPKEVMARVRARFSLARSTVYEYIKKHDSSLLN